MTQIYVRVVSLLELCVSTLYMYFDMYLYLVQYNSRHKILHFIQARRYLQV